MCVETLRRDNAVDSAIGLEKNLAFREIKVERLSFGTRARHRFIGSIERAQNRFDKRLGSVSNTAVICQLSLLVGQACRRTHDYPMERVRTFATVGTDHQPHG